MNTNGAVNVGVLLRETDNTGEVLVNSRITCPDHQHLRDTGLSGTRNHGVTVRIKLFTVNVTMGINEFH